MEGTDRESEGERDFTGVQSEQRREKRRENCREAQQQDVSTDNKTRERGKQVKHFKKKRKE